MSLTTSAHWMYASGGGFYDYEIDGSLRFDNSSYMTRTNGVPTDEDVWTFSAWVKRSGTASTTGSDTMLGAGQYPGNNNSIRFSNDEGQDELIIFNGGSGQNKGYKRSRNLYRDNGAWYHVCVSRNGGTIAMEVNGVACDIYTQVGFDASVNSQNSNGITHYVGASERALTPFSGYMAEVNFIDGQALAASYFGETKSGIWIPKQYSGSYGNNGYHLKFDGNLNDSSGNGNNFTASGIASHDYVLDSPTNNFPTFPKLALKGAGHTQHLEGNLQLYQPSWGGWDLRIASGNMPASGKYYWEVYPAQGSFNAGSGGFVMAFDNIRGKENMSGFPAWGAPMAYFESGGMGDYRVNPGWVSYTRSGSFAYTVNSTVFQVAVDCDNNKVWFGINNSWMGVSGTTVTAGTGNPATGANGQAIAGDVTDYTFAINCADQQSAARACVNFGQDSTFAGYKTAGGNADANGYGDFQYAPPSGFVALCSQNMPAPAIDPAADDTPEDYFNTVLYSGNGTSQSITGVGFQPDFVWVKDRTLANWHHLTDVIRGVDKRLVTNSTSAESTSSTFLTSFDADGFSIGSAQSLNQSGGNYAAWNWKAGGTGVSNTNGSITSTVSANPDAGFSIVTFTGDGTNATIGHGLGVTPQMIIIKNRTGTSGYQNWGVYHEDLGNVYNLYLNTTNSVATENAWNNTSPTSSVFTLGAGVFNPSGQNMVAYCFAEKDGYSKIGKYTGNGSTDGSFIYTGFRPALWLVKSSTAAGEPWMLMDNRRDSYNLNDAQLQAQDSRAETNDGNGIDFLSNGIKTRSNIGNWGTNGVTYIYMAFAEQPFKYANAR